MLRPSVRWLLAWLVAGAIAAAGLRSATLTLQAADAPNNWSRPPTDLVSEREFALATLRPLLSGMPEIGYATGVPNHRLLNPASEAAMERYFVTQYVLSPTRVSLRDGQPVVLADFRNEETLDRFLERTRAAVRWRSGGTALVQIP